MDSTKDGLAAIAMLAVGIAGCSGSSKVERTDAGEAGSPDGYLSGDSGRSDSGLRDAGQGGGAHVDQDSGPPPFSSCASGGAGVTNCGASQESCCTSLGIEGGTYYRTYDLDDDGGVTLAADGGPTGEADPATVSSFRLDKYLVTVGRFRRFVMAVMPTDAGPGGYTPEAGSGKHTHLNGGRGLANSGSPGCYESGWVTADDSYVTPTNSNLACEPPYDTWTSAASAQDILPINCVNWYESYAFCIWDGGFLPSEAEWEYAAAGGGGANGQREYPWGSTAPGPTNQYAIYGCNYYVGPPLDAGAGPCASAGNIAPVGTASLGAGYWGQLDLAGEMFEWNVDWYAPYAECTDCANLTLASSTIDYRVNRGGLFNLSASLLFPPYRNSVDPTGRSGGIGFRCERTP